MENDDLSNSSVPNNSQATTQPNLAQFQSIAVQAPVLNRPNQNPTNNDPQDGSQNTVINENDEQDENEQQNQFHRVNAVRVSPNTVARSLSVVNFPRIWGNENNQNNR